MKPVVLITADHMNVTEVPVPVHLVHDKYVRAIVQGAGALPWVLPAIGEALDFEALLERADGFFLTGSPSNVEPHHYGADPDPDTALYDPRRDATTLRLIPQVVERGIPLLAVCRGIQELNVALGGSLHQKVHEVPGKADHRGAKGVPAEDIYRDRHPVTLREGGLLRSLVGEQREVVNSVHWQGIDRLGQGLVVEAESDDGVIEAVRVATAPGFALGLQFHAEWQFERHALYSAVFAAFGAACREYARRRSPRHEVLETTP